MSDLSGTGAGCTHVQRMPQAAAAVGTSRNLGLWRPVLAERRSANDLERHYKPSQHPRMSDYHGVQFRPISSEDVTPSPRLFSCFTGFQSLAVTAHVIRVFCIELLEATGIAAYPFLVGSREEPFVTDTFPNTPHRPSLGHAENQSDDVEMKCGGRQFGEAFSVKQLYITPRMALRGTSPRHEWMGSPGTQHGEERKLLKVRVYEPKQELYLLVGS